MAATSSESNVEIKVARSLPIVNTGDVTLAVRPVVKDGVTGDQILVEVGQSALLVPGDYEVYPVPLIRRPPDGSGFPVVFPLASISYDNALQYFNVKVNPKTGIFTSGQFSVLVSLTDLKK